MKFVTTSHRARNARHFPPLAGSDRNDPQFKDLYWKVYDDKDAPVDEEFLKDWLKRTIELIDKYEPDVLWFDFGWHREEFLPYRLDLVSHYYNWAERVGKEVVMNYKDHVFDGAGVFNVERGKLAGIREGLLADRYLGQPQGVELHRERRASRPPRTSSTTSSISSARTATAC
jgi:alpha-L-fucosidase